MDNKKVTKKKLKFFVELIICCFIVFSVFSVRSITGKYWKKIEPENVEQVENNNNKTNTVNNNNNNENTVKKEASDSTNNEKILLTQEQFYSEMNNLINEYTTQKNKIGVVYKNFKTGNRFASNEQEFFSAASTTKVVYAMYIYDRIENGELTEDDEVPYNKNLFEDGGGKVTNNPKKDTYTVDELIQNMLTYSDNTATNLLLRNKANGIQVLTSYLEKLGETLPLDKARDNKVTPEMMEKVWTKLYENQDKYPKIIEYLKDSSNNEWIKDGIPDKTIASKYGELAGVANDTAIIYDSKGDYLLLIYTMNTSKASDTITDIANSIDKLNNQTVK